MNWFAEQFIAANCALQGHSGVIGPPQDSSMFSFIAEYYTGMLAIMDAPRA